jgi:outer membrane protein assembly factor BamB
LLVLFLCVSVYASSQVVLSSKPVQTESTPQAQEGAAPVWSHSLPALNPQLPAITAAALAPNGRCAAVAGSGKVDVLSAEGKVLWTWDYSKINKFIIANGLAVSPRCDEIALVGGSGYKYTWLVDRHGLKEPIQTTSTPLGIAFSRDGELVALGTGGCDLLLIHKSGELKWKKTYNSGFCIFGDLAFSPADKFIMLQAGLIRLDGAEVWTRPGWGMAAARDLQTFVTWSVPNHGPAVGSVFAMNAEGKELWSRVAPGQAAAISASGDKIAAPTYEEPEHDFSPEDWYKYQDQPVEIQLISRSGETLKTLSFEAMEVLAMSPDGNRILVRVPNSLEEIDANGNLLLKIPDPQMSYSKVFVLEDFSGALVWRRSVGNAVEWFTLK